MVKEKIIKGLMDKVDKKEDLEGATEKLNYLKSYLSGVLKELKRDIESFEAMLDNVIAHSKKKGLDYTDRAFNDKLSQLYSLTGAVSGGANSVVHRMDYVA